MRRPPDVRLRSQDDLLDRLDCAEKEIIFVVGAAISAPAVPESAAMVERVIRWFAESPKRRRQRHAHTLREKLARLEPYKHYRTAFRFLLESAGVDAANAIVREMVQNACRMSIEPADADADPSCWELPDAVQALGRYAAQTPKLFSRVIVTSNFDPLIEMAIRRAGGRCYSDVLAIDGHLTQTHAPGTRVVHVHGYWWGGDTLHTATQQEGHRPRLHQSLKDLFRNKQVVVLGYGGADGSILRALADVARDPQAYCDVLWAFHGDDVEAMRERYAPVFEALAPARQAARALFYGGVDVHTFLPAFAKEYAPRPFVDPDQPAARDQLLDHLLSRFESGASLQLVGAPNMGKTAVLNHFARALRLEGHSIVSIDARGVARRPAQLVQAIGDALGKRLPTWKTLSAEQAVPDEQAALRALTDLLPLNLFVDNADELALEGHGFTSSFFDKLATLVDRGLLLWVSASSRDLASLFAESRVRSAFLTAAEVNVIGALESTAHDELARTIPADRVAEVLQEAGPHAMPLMWWAEHWQRGSVPALRAEFRAWVRSLYTVWWPDDRAERAALKAAGRGVVARIPSARALHGELADRGLIHDSEAWWAFVGDQ